MQGKNTTYPVKFAVDRSIEHFNGMKDLFGKDINNLRLEEIELTEDEKYWLITLGFNCKIEQQDEPIINPLNPIVKRSDSTERVYKTFKVDGKTGVVKAIKMRNLD
jgi:hypothetical protein